MSSLPDLCLLVIFDQLPLRDLSRVNQVCWQWYEISKVSARKRGEISILVGRKRLTRDHYGGGELRYLPQVADPGPERTQLIYSTDAKLTRNVSLQLVAIFPNITKLEINLYKVSCLGHVFFGSRSG